MLDHSLHIAAEWSGDRARIRIPEPPSDAWFDTPLSLVIDASVEARVLGCDVEACQATFAFTAIFATVTLRRAN